MTHPPALLVLDAGTSAVRALAYDRTGRIVAFHTRSVVTSRPKPNHAEMDPAVVLRAVDQVLGRTLADLDRLGLWPQAMGLAVQRSSFLVYEPGRKRALTPLLTWQDIRADELLELYRGEAPVIAETTGLLLAPYYGGPKFAWLLEHRPELRDPLTAGRAFFVPLETLIIHHLNGNLLIDETIAGRTLLYDIGRRRWDPDLLALFGLDGALARCLPELVPSQYDFGQVNRNGQRWPLMVCQGDQQAAMAGLEAREPGTAAINYGTSGSVVVPTGDRPVRAPGLLAGPAFTSATHAEYLLEGTINAVGALFQWFERDLGHPGLARRWPSLAASQTGLVLIPGLNGLAAPYWRADVDTTFLPSRRGFSVGQQLRAGMESIAHLVADIVDALPEDVRPAVDSAIHCGGGMARPPLLQFQADLLQRQLWLHRRREATAWGVALRLAQALEWGDFGEVLQTGSSRYEPGMLSDDRKIHRARWREGIALTLRD